MPIAILLLVGLVVLVMTASHANGAGAAGFAARVDAAVHAAAPELDGDVRALIVAHAAYETDWGTQGSFAESNNLFNITAGSRWRGLTVPGPDTEYDAAGKVTNISQQWRAYTSLEDSVRDYLTFLSGWSYSAARAELLDGNPDFVRTLGREGYYTLPVDKYVADYSAALAHVRAALSPNGVA